MDIKKVREARELEMGFIRDRKVYKYSHKRDADKAGKKVIGVKWVDTNKGDSENVNYRSRLVAQEFKTSKEGALFAATPPLESLRVLLSLAASRTDIADKAGREGDDRTGIMVIDIKRAHFYTAAQRQVFVNFPQRTPGMANQV